MSCAFSARILASRSLAFALFLALGHELAFDGVLEQALFHGVWEALLDGLQLGLGFIVGIDIGLKFRYSVKDALLFG